MQNWSIIDKTRLRRFKGQSVNDVKLLCNLLKSQKSKPSHRFSNCWQVIYSKNWDKCLVNWNARFHVVCDVFCSSKNRSANSLESSIRLVPATDWNIWSCKQKLMKFDFQSQQILRNLICHSSFLISAATEFVTFKFRCFLTHVQDVWRKVFMFQLRRHVDKVLKQKR